MGNLYGPTNVLEVLFNLQTVYGDPRYRPSPWLRRRGAMLGLVVVLAFIALAVFAPWISPYDPIATSWSAAGANTPPASWATCKP